MKGVQVAWNKDKRGIYSEESLKRMSDAAKLRHSHKGENNEFAR